MLLTIARYLSILVLYACAPGLAVASWYNNGWTYRVPITVPTGTAINSTIKVDVDFAALLTSLGAPGTFDVNSPRIVRPDDATLATVQEFTDSVYQNKTDAVGNSRGELRFLLQDAGPTTYYLYFDVTANGVKAANPQMPINGNFEQGATAVNAIQNNPLGWNAVTTAAATFDAMIRPSESPTITTTNGSGNLSSATDGTPLTGNASFLIGARTNDEGNAYPSVTLSRSITVPATNPGNLTVNYRPEGWDSGDNGLNGYDFINIQIVSGGNTTTLVGPAANNYVGFPFSPNQGVNLIGNNNAGYGLYNYWDNDARGRHHSGMTLQPGAQPWFTRTVSLTPYAGQTITFQVQTNHTTLYKTWVHVDDVEWSVVAGTLGTAQVIPPLTASNFNAFETSTSPTTATTGVLTTKVAGQSFGFDVVALNSATPAGVMTNFAGSVKVEIVTGSGTTACAARTAILTVTSTYTYLAAEKGRHTFSGVVVPNAYRDALVRITSLGANPVVACSTDHFAVRPSAIVVTATHANWGTAGTTEALNNMNASGGVVHKAGQPFTLSATATTAASPSTVATLYDGTATWILFTTASSGCTGTACIGSPGAIQLGGAAATGLAFVSGTVTNNTAAYMDAGAVTLQLIDANYASIDSADTPATCAGWYVCSNVQVLGRFVPDNFAVTMSTAQLKTFNASDSECNSAVSAPRRSFTYLGQSFTYTPTGIPVFTVTARNAQNGTTANYAGALWHLSSPAGVAQSCTASVCTFTSPSGAATPTIQTSYSYTSSTADLPGWNSSNVVAALPVLTANGDGTGRITYTSGDILSFTRSPTAPIAKWNASIAITPQVNDTSETPGTIQTATPTAAPVTFDSGNEFRYGQIKVSNAYGSQLLPLPVKMVTQYWNGTGYVTNTVDHCTSLNSSNLTLSAGTGAPISTTITAGGNLLSGSGQVILTTPSPSPTGKGSVRLGPSAQLSGYLPGVAGIETFGIYKSGPVIYMREVY